MTSEIIPAKRPAPPAANAGAVIDSEAFASLVRRLKGSKPAKINRPGTMEEMLRKYSAPETVPTKGPPTRPARPAHLVTQELINVCRL